MAGHFGGRIPAAALHMMMVDAAHCCSFDAHEWSVTHDDFQFSIVSPSKFAELRITAYDCGRNATIDELIAKAKVRAGRLTEVDESSCGHFFGIVFRADEDDCPCQVWLLTLAEIMLAIDLTWEVGSIQDHLEAAAPILTSLRDARP